MAIGTYVTREQLAGWTRTDRVRVARIATAPADYRSPALAEDWALRVIAVALPADVVRAAHVLRISIALASMAVLPVVAGFFTEDGAETWGPLGTLGLLAIVLGGAQLRARRALVRVQLARAGVVRFVGWATVGYAALALGAIGLTTAGVLPAWWFPLGFAGVGLVLAPVLLFPLFVGLCTLRAGATMREAAVPKVRLEASPEHEPLLAARGPGHEAEALAEDDDSRPRNAARQS